MFRSTSNGVASQKLNSMFKLLNYSEMKSRNKLAMCRLCLCENECFVNVFQLNDGQDYIAAEVISDLIQFQVSETDGYPHVVCSKCFLKLTDFKLFKECCQKSKVKYDNMFVSSESLEQYQPEMVSIKSEELIIESSSYEVSEDPQIGTEVSCGPILLKYEVLPFGKNRHTQEELIDSGVSVNQGTVESTATLMQDSPQAELAHLKNPEHLQGLGNKRLRCTSKGEIDADSRTWSISTNDKSKNILLAEDGVASSSRTLGGLRIFTGGHTAPFFQQDISVGNKAKNERGRMEEGIGEDDGRKRTSTEEGVGEGKEGMKCFHCGTVVMSKDTFIHHMKRHGFGVFHECPTCGKIFDFDYELEKHVLSHTGCDLYTCAECSKCFSKISGLKRHAKLHADPKLYKCTACSNCFSEISDLKRHAKLHADPKPYKCTECSKCFSEISDLKRHAKSHADPKPYKCTECIKCYSHKRLLNGHVKTHIRSNPHKCAECSKCFSKHSLLNKHMRIHTDSKPYKCAKCSKCFRRNSQLNIHIRTHTGTIPYKCTECSECFHRKGHLIEHMKSHPGCKPYKCTECSKSYSQNSHLIVHMRSHTGSRPYKCAECSKCFSRNGSLKDHMRTHTGSKPYKCVQCSKSFSQSGNLKTHMRTHTSSLTK